MYKSIIISGLPISGKSTLIRRLSEILNWKIHSIGESWRKRWKQLYPNAEVSFEEFWRNVSLKEQLEVNIHAKEILKAGKVIGDSRYSIYCEGSSALLVFLYAHLDIRVERAANTEKYKGKSLKEINQILIRREIDETRIGKALFGDGYDYKDPKHYHLLLNSGMSTVDEEILVISSLVR